MATLYALKPRFQALLRPLVRQLADMGVTANQVTIAAAAGSVLIGLLVASYPERRTLFLLLPVWLFLRMALNAIDGMLAREFGQKSDLGGYLNELGDVLSDAALYAPFAMIPPFEGFATGMVIVLSILTEFAGVLSPIRRYDGPMGKSDRALLAGALALWIGIGGALPDGLRLVMPVMSALLAVTIINRVRMGLRGDKDAA